MRFRRLTSSSYLMLAVLLALTPESCPKGPKPDRKPWVTKDWTEWTKEECAVVLQKSPWTSLRSVTQWDWSNFPGDLHYVFHYGILVSWRGALPIRQALIRLDQLEHNYDLMSDTERAIFDAGMEARFEVPADRIVLRVAEFIRPHYGPANERVIPFHVFLVRRDGLEVAPLEIRPLPGAFERSELGSIFRRQMDVFFPREVDGQPVIRPEDGEIEVVIRGHLMHEVFRVRKRRFNLHQMIHKDRLEY